MRFGTELLAFGPLKVPKNEAIRNLITLTAKDRLPHIMQLILDFIKVFLAMTRLSVAFEEVPSLDDIYNSNGGRTSRRSFSFESLTTKREDGTFLEQRAKILLNLFLRNCWRKVPDDDLHDQPMAKVGVVAVF